MFKTIQKEKGNLEISMEGHLTALELQDIISDLKSAKKEHGRVNILMDFSTLTGYDKISSHKTNTIEPILNGIDRVAVVSRGVTALSFQEFLKNISKNYRNFNEKDIGEARKWAFRVEKK